MNITKTKILLISLLIGIVLTSPGAYMAGFSQESILNWILNALFVTAICGFLGTKFITRNEPPKR